MVLGDNGLINKAQSSVNKYQQSANNEQAMLNSIEDYFKEYMPGEEMPLPDGWDGTKVTAISDGKHYIIPVPKDFYYVGGNLNNGVIISDNPALCNVLNAATISSFVGTSPEKSLYSLNF